MNVDDLSERLRDLPPELFESVDRFDEIAARARRRRRRRVATGAGLVSVCLVVAGVGLARTRPEIAGSDGGHAAHQSGSGPSTSTGTALPGQGDVSDGGSDAVLPGGRQTEELSDAQFFTGVGTQTVDLGDRPPGVTAIETSLACLSAGRFRWPDGAAMVCSASDAVDADTDPRDVNSYQLPLAPGQSLVVIRATRGSSWKIVTTYVHTTTTEWGVNAKGETYGVDNDDGSPDLIAVHTTDGTQGYAYARDLNGPQPTSPAEALAQQEANEGKSRTVPVYESDGVTVIGSFTISPGESSAGERGCSASN